MGIFDWFQKENTDKKVKIKHLANLFIAANSDGEISNVEQKKINEIRKDFGVSESEYNNLVVSILDGSFAYNPWMDTPKSDKEAWKQLQEIAELIVSDGYIDDKEIEFFEKISSGVGYPENDLINKLKASQESFNTSNIKDNDLSDDSKGCMYVSSSGETYYLHKKETFFRSLDKSKIIFFFSDTIKEEGFCELPEDKVIVETYRGDGPPLVKKIGDFDSSRYKENQMGKKVTVKKHTKTVVKKVLDNTKVYEKDVEDVGIVTHYKGKPYTGKLFGLFPTGEIRSETEMVEGLKNGKDIHYFKNGNISIESTCIQDIYTGLETRFNSDGSIYRQVTYENNMKQGEARYYQNNGELYYHEFYKDNLVVDYDEDGWSKNDHFNFDSPDNIMNDTFLDVLKESEIFHDKFWSNLELRKKRNHKKDKETSAGFAKGWNLSEMGHAYSFAIRFAFKYYKGKLKDDDRSITIIEFIQMCYKNTHQINSIEGNDKWKKFSANMVLNDDLGEEGMKCLVNMKESKRNEFMFLLICITNITHSINQNSNKNDEEINSMRSKINNLFSETEKMMKVTLSKEDYDNLYIKYCDEDDKQNKAKDKEGFTTPEIDDLLKLW